MYKWPQAVQTCVGQGSTVYLKVYTKKPLHISHMRNMEDYSLEALIIITPNGKQPVGLQTGPCTWRTKRDQRKRQTTPHW